jgi:hypothetical protein
MRKDRPLPGPPKTPFRNNRFIKEHNDNAPLMADKMAAAMAEGRLEEFMREELPDNEYARALASMMMGMTGMLPGAFPGRGEKEPEQPNEGEEGKRTGEKPSGVQPPEDVLGAVRSGDVKALTGLLQREHEKRMEGAEPLPAADREPAGSALSSAEKETLDRVTEIAAENNVSVDWMVLRALKLYIREYMKSGRL